MKMKYKLRVVGPAQAYTDENIWLRDPAVIKTIKIGKFTYASSLNSETVYYLPLSQVPMDEGSQAQRFYVAWQSHTVFVVKPW